MIVREFFAKLGLSVDTASFALGDALLGGVSKTLASVATVALAANAALMAMVSNVAESAKRIDDLAQSTGLSVTSLQELGYAASFSGGDLESTAHSMTLLSRQMNVAVTSGGAVAATFAKFGVHLKDNQGKLRSSDEVLGDIADKFQKMPNGAEKTAAAMEMFGRGGAQMIPLLNRGRNGLEALRKEARDLGVVMGDETVKQGAALEDSWTRLKVAGKGLEVLLAGPLFSSTQKIIDSFVEWYKVNKNLLALRLDRIIQVITASGKLLWMVLSAVGAITGFVIDNFEALAVVLVSGLLAAVFLNTAGVTTMGAAYVLAGAKAVYAGLSAAASWIAAAAPVIALAALLATVLLVAEDIAGWINGDDSLIGTLWDNWKGLLADVKAGDETDNILSRAIKDAIFELMHFWEVYEGVKEAVTGFVDSAVKGFEQDVLGMDTGEDNPSIIDHKIRTLAQGLQTGAVKFGNGVSPSTAAQKTSTPPARGGDINQHYEVKIDATGATDPEAVVSGVRKAMQEIIDSHARELQGVGTLGGKF